MATLKIDTHRYPYNGIEKFTDAAFIPDDKKLYFGNDGDVNFEYDEDGGDLGVLTGNTNIPHFITNTSTAIGSDVTVIPITHGIVEKNVGSDAEALTLANGTDGQLLAIHATCSDVGTLTPATSTAWATIVFSDTGDTAVLQFVDSTIGWIIRELAGANAPPTFTV